MNVSNKEKDIFQVIAYFSYFGYPLTPFEIWKWQYKPKEVHSLADILLTLRSSEWIKTRVESARGFYGLHSKKFGHVERQIHLRHNRFLNAVKKYKKMKWILMYLSRLPYVKGIAICNSLVFHHTREESDIDLFLITTEDRVWTTRLLAVVPLILFKQRPGERKKNPIDVSFLVAESASNLMSFKIGEEDPYLAVWTRSLIPLHGREDSFQTFTRHNAWSKVLLPNSRMPRRARAFRYETAMKFPGVGISESLCMFIQRKRFPHDITLLANKDNRVVVKKDVLKFHKNDRREDIQHALERKTSVAYGE